jgi:hypothetical protein
MHVLQFNALNFTDDRFALLMRSFQYVALVIVAICWREIFVTHPSCCIIIFDIGERDSAKQRIERCENLMAARINPESVHKEWS